MVAPFQFAKIPTIYFGNGKIALLPEIASAYGSRLVIVTGKKSFLKSKQSEILFDNLKKNSFPWRIVSISGEPTPEIIDNAINEIGDEKIDLIVAIGGGSVIDAGKAISAMLYKNESVIDFLEGIGIKNHSGTKVPFIGIPTTAGTGSEATKNAVISRIGKNGFKRSLRHDNFVPDIALVDPELTISCENSVTIASGMDCFTQLTEAYLSTKSNPYTDALVLEGIKAIKKSFERCYTYSDDLEARSGMSFAALTSGICLANAGLVSCMVLHRQLAHCTPFLMELFAQRLCRQSINLM